MLRLARAIRWGLAAALFSLAGSMSSQGATPDSSPPGDQSAQTGSDSCKFLIDKASAIVATLDPKGDVTFLNHYGRSFFGYSEEEILGKPMLGTLTPLTGFQGRDLASFMNDLVHEPNRYAFSVNHNMKRDGEHVWVFWANKGIYDEQGAVQEVIRVGLDITTNKRRLEAAAQELRGISDMLEGRSWVQRSKLKEITARLEEISEDLERPWAETKSGVYESVAPPPKN